MSIFLSALLLSISCKHAPQKEVYISEPTLSPVQNYLTENFDESFFSENHYGYAQFMKYDSSGKLTYQYPGGLTNSFLDTTRYYHSAEIIIQAGSSNYYFRNCIAKKSNDSLVLLFNDHVFSRNDYELSVFKTKTSIHFQYDRSFSITDSSYRRPVYNVIDPGLLLDKKEYQKADSIKGKIHFTVIGHHSWPTVYNDTATVYGLIKTVVE